VAIPEPIVPPPIIVTELISKIFPPFYPSYSLVSEKNRGEEIAFSLLNHDIEKILLITVEISQEIFFGKRYPTGTPYQETLKSS
jgi:hypothetical protein